MQVSLSLSIQVFCGSQKVSAMSIIMG